jgi:NACHT domain
LQFVLVFALMFGLVMGAAVPNGAQTPTPTPDSSEAVEQQIKKYAERHVENDQSMQTSNVIKVFEKNTANLSPVDVATIYEEEYAKQKKTKDEDFWEQIKPKAGWIVAAMVFMFALFQGKLKTWVENGVGKLEKGIYQRFSGTKWFWDLALEKYRKALVEKHGELKIPFRPNRPLKMDEVYVPLKVAGNRADKENVDAMQAVQDYRRLMVTGQPGSGKTMLLRYLALNYGAGKLRLADNPVVILLEFHRLVSGTEILTALVAALARDDFPNGESFLKQALKVGRVVLLLDGLDEVNSVDRAAVINRIQDFLDLHEKCGVVITCRSQVYRGEFDGVVKQTLEVVEFTDAQIQQFLRPWQVEMPTEKSVQQLVQALNNRPRIKEMARNPLLLTIIAYLYCDTPFVLPHSRAEFYTKSTEILLETWDQARQTPNVYKGVTKRLVLQHLALYAQDSAEAHQQDRKTLSFQEVMREVQAVLPGLNLDGEKDLQPVVDEIVERSGLLLKIDGGARYQFSHLTLQEFFSAAALNDRPQEMITRVKDDADAWREVVKLWCGLANDATEVVRQIYAIQPVMGLECIADAQQIESTLADEIIGQLRPRLRQARQTDVLEQAFAAVAADTRPRGQCVFNFLVDALKQPGESTEKILSIHALSLTNLPKAAAILREHYQDSPDIRQAIVRMGDIAVPELSKIAERGISVAIDDLMMIGTPDAAEAMIPFLWHSNRDIAGNTAWYLAGLLRQSEIEATLQKIRLNPKEKSSGQWDWIWIPFTVSSNSERVKQGKDLLRLIGKIADLLNQCSNIIDLDTSVDPDPRIAIPICAFSEELRKALPNQLPSDAQFILQAGKSYIYFPREIALQESLSSLLGTVISSESWVNLLATLSPETQLDLLSRLIAYQTPHQQDWINIFARVKYSFSESPQYYVVLLVSLFASISAITEASYVVIQVKYTSTSWWIGLPVLVIIYAWFTVWQGSKLKDNETKTLDPDLFLKFGILGWLEFWENINLRVGNKAAWTGEEPFFEIVNKIKAVSTAATGICIGVSASAVAIIVATNTTRDFAGKIFFDNTNQSINNVIPIPLFVTNFIIVFLSFVTIAFVGFWYQTRRKSKHVSWVWAILVYPFFCSAPFVVIYSALGLHNWFSWPMVAGIWIALIIGCTTLWKWGQAKERKARNPLQGILDGYDLNPNLAPNRRRGFFTSPKS